MFKPIIHNLTVNDQGFAQVQVYNRAIANKPKAQGTLSQTLAALSVWSKQCEQYLEEARRALSNEVTL